ncbi:hypothetical protein Tco_0618796, partial [Tanacetum coccineum]
EILIGYGRKNGPKRCDMKIDLQKAYGTISWSFLETVLNGFGFHSKMVGWIMQCVTTAGFTICLNKMLTLLLQRKIRNNDDFKYHHGCKELKLVNLCFADDLMIFCHGDVTSAGVVNDADNIK